MVIDNKTAITILYSGSYGKQIGRLAGWESGQASGKIQFNFVKSHNDQNNDFFKIVFVHASVCVCARVCACTCVSVSVCPCVPLRAY